jgi:alkaline phosphatase D
VSQKAAEKRLRANPNLLFADSDQRGYLLLDVDRERLEAQLVAMETVARADASRSVLATFVVESGRPGPIRA